MHDAVPVVFRVLGFFSSPVLFSVFVAAYNNVIPFVINFFLVYSKFTSVCVVDSPRERRAVGALDVVVLLTAVVEVPFLEAADRDGAAWDFGTDDSAAVWTRSKNTAAKIEYGIYRY